MEAIVLGVFLAALIFIAVNASAGRKSLAALMLMSSALVLQMMGDVYRGYVLGAPEMAITLVIASSILALLALWMYRKRAS